MGANSVVVAYPGLPYPERITAYDFVRATVLVLEPVLAVLAVKAVFLAHSPLWWERRLAVFVGYMGLTIEERTAGDVTIDVYVCPPQTLVTLLALYLAGDLEDCPTKPVWVNSFPVNAQIAPCA